MKSIYTFITLFLCFISIGTSAQEKTYLSNAVNIAGKQRMLGQRMAKNKVYLAANKKTDYAKKELEETIINFEKGIIILKDFAPTPAVKNKVAIQEYAFKNYKNAVLGKSSESLLEIVETNTLFLAICDDVVTELIKYSKETPKKNITKHQSYVHHKIAEATGASGKLRYLTQRLTLYFAMNEFGTKNVSPAELDEIMKTMDKNLTYLTLLEFNTLDIDDSLSQVQYYWNQLKKNLYQNGKVNMKPQRVNATTLYKLCNIILDKANTATKMYADLNKE